MRIRRSPVNGSPVRKVVPTSRGVTGTVPKFGVYESSLERDFMEILRFDPDVQEFTPQPITIEYINSIGKKAKYTPDGLIKFSTALCLQPVLFEIKHRKDFRKEWRTLMPKFRAAKLYAMNCGWRFEVFTEREIRTPYLANVKFLWQFVERRPTPAMATEVLNVLEDLDEADAEFLLCALCYDKMNQARYIPVIWHLVAIGLIDCDLENPLTMRTVLYKSGENDA